MEFIDTHCHIQSAGSIAQGEASTRQMWAKAGDHNPYELFWRGQVSGVTTAICVGCDVDDSALAIGVASHEERLFASIGIHPHEAQRYVTDKLELARFRKFAKLPKVVAVGECGLDYFYEHSPKPAQISLLQYQIALALEHDLPLIFHVREAFEDFWPIFDSFLTQNKALKGVLHSFTDNMSNLDMALSRGLYVGVNGIATFAKSPQQLDMYKSIPLSRLLLETDSPFLTPSPYRGKICEPYHTRVTAEFLAELRHEPLEQLAAASTANARQLFDI